MGTVTVHMTDIQGVLLGFCDRHQGCRNMSCVEFKSCQYHCEDALLLHQEKRRKNGLGAGDGAHLPSGLPGERGGPDDFIAGEIAWDSGTSNAKDPHDGDFDDRQLPIFR